MKEKVILEEFTNKELTKSVIRLTKLQEKNIDVLKDFVEKNIETHMKHIKNTESLIDTSESTISTISKIIDLTKFNLYIASIALWISISPFVSELIWKIFISFNNISEAYQVWIVILLLSIPLTILVNVISEIIKRKYLK